MGTEARAIISILPAAVLKIAIGLLLITLALRTFPRTKR
jgi:hypothetical protein